MTQTLLANAQSQAMEVFRNRVKRLLEAKEMTIQDLADAAGTNRPYLSRVLSGKSDPTIPYAESIAAALDAKLADLISSEKKSKKTA